MNDIFIEQLVTRKRRIKDTVIFIAVILAVILIPVTFAVLVMGRLILAYFLYIAFFLFVFGIWGIWFVLFVASLVIAVTLGILFYEIQCWWYKLRGKDYVKDVLRKRHGL